MCQCTTAMIDSLTTAHKAKWQTLRNVEERIGDQICSACIAYPVQLYVALSRSSGREMIRLLRNFKDELFMPASHDPQLMAEDDLWRD